MKRKNKNYNNKQGSKAHMGVLKYQGPVRSSFLFITGRVVDLFLPFVPSYSLSRFFLRLLF